LSQKTQRCLLFFLPYLAIIPSDVQIHLI
jgi:hypothetical protein